MTQEDELDLGRARKILTWLELKAEELPAILMDEELDEDYSPEGETIDTRLLKHYRENSLHGIKTVRFLKDFQILKARPDLTTTNKTFIRTSEIFRKMGIKNYYFHLQLNNPLLVGVDPFDPNLTDKQKLMIFKECQENFWYFIREVCHLNGGIKFKGNRANISFAWCWLNHLTSLLIMPRQKGKTVTSQVITFWLTYIVPAKTSTHLITLKEDNRQQFVNAVKGIRASIPDWLTNMNYRDKDSGKSLTYSAFGENVKSELVISVPQIGEEAAGNVGRGLTTENRFVDEPSYIRFMETILNGAGPSTLTARKLARENGMPYGTELITTPASKLTDSGAYMYNMLMEATEWRETYFDCFSESHLNRVLIANSNKPGVTSPTIGMVYNYLQLGENKDWVRRTIDELKLTITKAKIDLLMMWDEDDKDRLLSPEVREVIKNNMQQPLWTNKPGGNDLYFNWFITKEKYAKIVSGEDNSFYLIGVDTSSSIGKDACTVVIRDIRTGFVIGCGRYQLAYLNDVGNILINLLQDITNSLLIPERNYASHMIDQLLLALPALGIDPFKRIFNQIFQDPYRYSNEYKEVKMAGFNGSNERFYLKFKQYFGFNTTSETRSQLYGFLEEAVSMTGLGIFYVKLIDELISLRVINGRVDHDRKHNDDLVVAWLLTYWFIKLGDNKNDYGIPPGIGLMDAKIIKLDGIEKTEIDLIKEARDKAYKMKFDEITEKLMNCDNDIVARRLEAVLEKINGFMSPSNRKVNTVDDIKRDAEEARKRRYMEARRSSTSYGRLH